VGAVVLVAAGMIALPYPNMDHLARAGLTCFAAAAGWVLAVYPGGGPRVALRLGLLIIGLAGAAAAWLFVPVHGLSLWQAREVVAETDALEAGDLKGFRAGLARRRLARGQFPEIAGAVAAAEGAWIRRTADAALAAADRTLPENPARACHILGDLEDTFDQMEPRPRGVSDLTAARERAARELARQIGARLEALCAAGKYADVAELAAKSVDRPTCMLAVQARDLGLQDALRPLKEVRARAVRARLDAARVQARSLLRENRFADVAALGEETGRQLRAEARAAGVGKDLDAFCDSCRAQGKGAARDGRGTPRPGP
jgi:hypothetical protein